MPSRFESDEELRKHLLRRIDMLRKNVQQTDAGVIVAHGLANVVVTARLLFGCAKVDEIVDARKAESDAGESGMCPACKKNPSSADSAIVPHCNECWGEMVKVAEEEERQLLMDGLGDNSPRH